ncbi:hypothetical protein [Bacillus cereus]|nr:hypothetical protein [Bacillus cereus]
MKNIFEYLTDEDIAKLRFTYVGAETADEITKVLDTRKDLSEEERQKLDIQNKTTNERKEALKKLGFNKRYIAENC